MFVVILIMKRFLVFLTVDVLGSEKWKQRRIVHSLTGFLLPNLRYTFPRVTSKSFPHKERGKVR